MATHGVKNMYSIQGFFKEFWLNKRVFGGIDDWKKGEGRGVFALLFSKSQRLEN
jgi:hypothetical protein